MSIQEFHPKNTEIDSIHNRISDIKEARFYANREWDLQIAELLKRVKELEKDG